MVDSYKELQCEKCGCISKQNTTTGVIYKDDNGIFFVYSSAKCPDCGNRFNYDRSKNAKKSGVFM